MSNDKATPRPWKGKLNEVIERAIARGLRLTPTREIVLPSGKVAAGSSKAFHGYRRIWLYEGGRKYNFTRARIVCWLSHGPPPAPHWEVDHINRDRGDDRPENLRWASPVSNSDNMSDIERARRSRKLKARHANCRRIHAAHDAMCEALEDTLDAMRSVVDTGALKTPSHIEASQRDAMRVTLHEAIANARAALKLANEK